MVTLKDIAAACGVSPTTVSNILNGKAKASDETVKNVLETVKRLNYHPNFMAKGLRTRSTKTIAIIAEDIHQMSTPPIISAVMEKLEENGYSAILENLRLYDRWSDSWFDSNQALWSILEPALRRCISYNVDGIIYIAGHARKIECIPSDFQIPIVMTYAYSVNPNTPSVVINDERGAYEVLQYLLLKGHKKIAFVTGRQDNIHTQLRYKGALQAMYDYNCVLNPTWVQEGDWTRSGGYKAAKKLDLQHNPISAIFTMNDEMAAGVYDVIEEAGLEVAKDISVVGFDNAAISNYFRPALTTTELPLAAIGRKGAELLIEKLQLPDPLSEVPEDKKLFYIPCSFIERTSVKNYAGDR